MSFTWMTEMDGYRARIKTDFPADAVVYTSNMMMAPADPLSVLTNSMRFWGDLSSSNVIVVGCDGLAKQPT
jgi:hypothetical protein